MLIQAFSCISTISMPHERQAVFVMSMTAVMVQEVPTLVLFVTQFCAAFWASLYIIYPSEAETTPEFSELGSSAYNMIIGMGVFGRGEAQSPKHKCKV